MDNGSKIAVAVIVVALVSLGGFYGYSQGWFDKKDETPPPPPATQYVVVNNPQQPQQYVPATAPSDNEPVPVEQIDGAFKDKFTQAAVTDGYFRFYVPGADVSDPYVQPIDSIDVSGSANTNLIIQTNTQYDVYYESDGATYYDDELNEWQVNYNPETGKGYLLIAGKAYYAVSPVGTFVTQTSLPEEQSGMNDSSGTLYYDESSLGGSGWWKMDIGNNDANSELKEVVMCFRDNDGDMEGTEVTAFTAAFDSGSSAISIPGSLQQYWEDAMGGAGAQCVDIAAVLGSSQKTRWVMTMTVDESAFDTDEEFEMTFDDLGNYLQKQYPSRNAKATSASLTVGDQA